MAKIPGTNVASPIAPFTTDDQFPTHDAIYGKGGQREVATIAERDAIPLARLTEGCTCYVAATEKTYRWKSNAWVDDTPEFASDASDISYTPSGSSTPTNVAAALDGKASTSALTDGLAGKQGTINDLNTIRSGAGKGATSVQGVKMEGDNNPLTPDGNGVVTIPQPEIPDAVTSVIANNELVFQTPDGQSVKGKVGISTGADGLLHLTLTDEEGHTYSSPIAGLRVNGNALQYSNDGETWVTVQTFGKLAIKYAQASDPASGDEGDLALVGTTNAYVLKVYVGGSWVSVCDIGTLDLTSDGITMVGESKTLTQKLAEMETGFDMAVEEFSLTGAGSTALREYGDHLYEAGDKIKLKISGYRGSTNSSTLSLRVALVAAQGDMTLVETLLEVNGAGATTYDIEYDVVTGGYIYVYTKSVADNVFSIECSLAVSYSNVLDKKSIEDSLTSESTAKVLSAKQGKVLGDALHALEDKAEGYDEVKDALTRTQKVFDVPAIFSNLQRFFSSEPLEEGTILHINVDVDGKSLSSASNPVLKIAIMEGQTQNSAVVEEIRSWNGYASNDEVFISESFVYKMTGSGYVYLYLNISNIGYSDADISIAYEIDTSDALNEIIDERIEDADLGNVPMLSDNQSDVDFEVSDEKGNSIVAFKNGHIRTKNFNSEDSSHSLSVMVVGTKIIVQNN